jgi:hypothetical protein
VMCHEKYGSQSAFWEPNREPRFRFRVFLGTAGLYP